MKRVVLVTNTPTPYRIPLFNELDRQLSEVGVKLVVVFGSNTYERKNWVVDLSFCTFEYYVLQSNIVGPTHQNEVANPLFPGLVRMLKRMDPDLVIAPGFSLATMKIWMQSFTQRFAFIIWTGSVEQGNRYDSLIRVMQRRILASGASAFVVYGSVSRAYVEKLGVPADKVFIGINTVDTSFFSEQTRVIREQLPPSECKHLTYVGHLSRQKKVSDLVKTIIHLAQKRDDFIFEVIGDGEELPILRNLVSVNQMGERIVFRGHQPKEDLPMFFARSNGLLLQPGFDTWGLVLNEAMAAGVPCVAPRHACAVQDLLKESDLGLVIDYSDREHFIEAIEWLLDNPSAGKEMGKNAQDFVTQHASLAQSASGFVRAVQKSLGLPRLQSV